LPQAILIGGLAVASVYFLIRRGSPAAFVGVACFLVLAPTTILPLATGLAAEHRVYFPLALLIPLAAATADALLERLVIRLAARPPPPPPERVPPATPAFPAPRRNLGTAHFQLGHTALAIDNFHQARRLSDDAATNLCLGNALLADHRPAEARPCLERAVT